MACGLRACIFMLTALFVAVFSEMSRGIQTKYSGKSKKSMSATGRTSLSNMAARTGWLATVLNTDTPPNTALTVAYLKVEMVQFSSVQFCVF